MSFISYFLIHTKFDYTKSQLGCQLISLFDVILDCLCTLTTNNFEVLLSILEYEYLT